MYNQNYEEYMRSVLGYNTGFRDNTYNNMYMDNYNMTRQLPTYEENINLEKFYPETYKIIYPLVCKTCSNVKDNITEELIGKMTNDNNRKEVKKEEKRDQNFLLKDLIRILILKELLGNKNHGQRPPFPPNRPPMPRSIYEQRFFDNEYLY